MADISRGGSFPAIASNFSALPYPVRPRGWPLYGSIAVSIIFVVFAVVMVSVVFLPSSDVSTQWTTGLVGAAFAAIFGYRLWNLYKPDVVLYPDRIEKRNLLGRWRSLSRSQIKGVGRTIYSRSGSYFEISPLSPNESAIRLPASARKDPVVAEWLRGAQDPEAAEKAADRAAVLADSRFGATEAERAGKLERARQVVIGFGAISVGLGIWAYVSATPYWLTMGGAVLAPLPAWLIFRWGNGLVLWLGKDKVRPQVGLLSVIPGVALGISAGIHNRLYDPWILAGACALLGIALGVSWFFTHEQTPTGRTYAIIAGAAVALSVFGLISTGNIALDQSVPKITQVQTLEKRVSHGKSTSYYLTLSGWSRHAGDEFDVDYDLYDAIAVGDPVCVTDHPGAIGLPWYQLGLCKGFRSPDRASQSPANMDDAYPERAKRLSVEGSVSLACKVTPTLALSDCQVTNESPSGYGFGEAAKKRMENGNFRIQPSQLTANRVFRAHVNFKLGD